MVDRFIWDVTSHYTNYKMSKDMTVDMQVGARPIQLYEFIIPEENRDYLLELLQPQKPWNTSFNKYAWLLRKSLNLDPLPELKFDVNKASMMRRMGFVNVIGLGIKKDKFIDGYEKL